MTGAEPLGAAVARASLPAKFSLAMIAVFAATLTVKLWPEWSADPNLSHGFFAPLACLFLLQESRRIGPLRQPRPGWALYAAVAGLGLAGIAALAFSGLFAVSLGWNHSAVDFGLTAAFVFLAAASVAAFSDEGVRLVPLNWISAVAVGLWILSAPIPPGTYTRLTLELQLWVSRSVLDALHILGVAAHREGNVIDLASGSVGVEDACSGVRSLVSCVFAGFLFSAALATRPWARAVLIAVSAPLALAMNFVRSLTLTLLVNHGVSITGPWHDATGYAVLGVTAAILIGLALALGGPAAPAPPRSDVRPASRPAGPQIVLTVFLLLAAGVLVFFRASTRPAERPSGPGPDLQALVPAQAAGWSTVTTDDLYRFSGTLRTDRLVQRTYARKEAGRMIEITIYAAYWAPGQASVSLVASHTPDACWPGAGWTAHPSEESRVRLAVGGRPLAGPAESRYFTDTAGFPQYVWFWHLYDGRPIAYDDPYSLSALLRIALRYGFHKSGDQMFIRISSNRPWRDISLEPVVEGFFAKTQRLGL